MSETEELREALLDLERARSEERTARITTESLLEGLEALTRTVTSQEMFVHFLEALRKPLQFGEAFFLLQLEEEVKVVASTNDCFKTNGFRAKPLLQKLLPGKPIAMFDIAEAEEWQQQPECIKENVVSALLIPLITSNFTAALICVKNERSFFTRSHLKLMKRFVPLALGAIERLRNMEQLKQEGILHEKSKVALTEYREQLEDLVTERNKDVVDNNRRMQAVQLGSQAGVWDINLETGELFLDEKYADMLGYTVKEMVKDHEKSWEALIHSDDLAEVKEELKQLFDGQSNIFEMEYRMLAKSGSHRWIMDTAKITSYDDNGRPTRVTGIHMDITERKQNEIIMKRSEQRFIDFTEAASDWYWETDAENHFIWFSDRVEELLGVPTKNLLGHKRIEVRADIENTEKLKWEEHLKTIQEHKAFRDFEYLLHGNVKGDRWLRISGKPYYDDIGIYAGYRGTGTDITNYHKAEESRIELEAQLRQSQKMEAIGTLAGGVAHDFNNILQGMSSTLELIQMDIAEDAIIQDDLNMLSSLRIRASDLVHQILTFSRYDTQKQEVIEVESILIECLKMLRSTLPKSIKIEENLNLPTAKVMGNATQIHQVLINLCVNAGHSMEAEGGILGISMDLCDQPEIAPLLLNPDKDYLCISVKDSGIGMEQEVIARIFEPFFTTKEQGKGTGLGLSVIDGIIDMHQGKIHVESKVGEGSFFRVYLPLIEDNTNKAEIIMEKENSNDKPSYRILIVDDEEEILSMQKRLLKRLGHEVESCNSGECALNYLKDHNETTDLIITDQTMPGITGMELSHKCKEIYPNLRIILSTGYSADELPEQYENAGIKSILPKPYSREVLTNTIAEVMK